ncbi:MAG: TIGR02996 domain-containing protein [Kofleriaceae bacterium]
MASCLAIISKAIFEKQAGGNGEGDVVALTEYAATPKQLDELEDGDALFLVTVRPPDETLWLVAVLESPTKGKGGWKADANTVAITDISDLKAKLVFANGKGLPTEEGKLAMSLQTPRVLTDADLALLRGEGGGAKKSAKSKSTASGTSKATAAKTPGSGTSKTTGSGSTKSTGSGTSKSTGTSKSPSTTKSTASGTSKSTSTSKTSGSGSGTSKTTGSGSTKSTASGTSKSTGTSKTSGSGSGTSKTTDSGSTKSSSTKSSGVDSIVAAAKSGNAADVLLAALEVWRGQRAPELADFIDKVGAKLTTTPPTDQSEISKLAVTKDSRVLGTLLAAVTETTASFLPTLAEMLAAFPDDPRFAKAFSEWIMDPPTTSSSTYPFWTATMKAITRIDDMRIVPAINKRMAMKPEKSQFWPKFYNALEKLRDKLDKPDVIELDGAAALKKINIGTLKSSVITASTPKASAKASLDDALKSLQADKPADCVAAMVAKWRELKAPELANAIDTVSRLLPGWNRPLVEEDAWDELFAKDANAYMPQLLLNLHNTNAKQTEIRLARLLTIDEDPRVALRCAELSGGIQAGPERTQYWKALNDHLTRHKDVRTIGPLIAEYEDFSGTYYNNFRQAKSQISSWVLNPPATPKLDKAAAALVAKIEKLATSKESREEHALVDAIAAEPKSVAPRAIYADWLQEHGHPLGEYLALMASPSETKASKDQLKKLAKLPYLRGHLTDFLSFSVEYDQGLVVAAESDYRTTTLSWRAAAHVPLARLFTTLATSRNMPTQDDFAALVAAAPKLEKITFENKPANPYKLAGWSTSKDGSMKRA